MESVKFLIEFLWSAAIGILWRLWIFFAIIVLVYVKFGNKSMSKESRNQRLQKAALYAFHQKSLKQAKKLMKSRKFAGASDMLLLAAQQLEGKLDVMRPELLSVEAGVIAARLHELRSLSLYQQGDVIASMSEMDQGLAKVRAPDSRLLNSANSCFQFFLKWCLENSVQFEKNILTYFSGKKNRLENAAVEGTVSPSLLLESVHCSLLSDFLVSRGMLSSLESLALKELSEGLCCSLKSQVAQNLIC